MLKKSLISDAELLYGIVFNPNHGVRKFRKAGQSQWLGRRPVVRGVAMNPVDHPHGRGEALMRNEILTIPRPIQKQSGPRKELESFFVGQL